MIINSLDRGGAETVMVDLMNVLKKNNIDLHVISLLGKGNVYNDIANLGIKVSAINKKKSIFFVFSFIKLLLLLIRTKPDVVHTWMYHSDLFGGLAAKIAGVKKIIWSIHNTNLDKDKTKLSTRITVRICVILAYWIPTGVIFCSIKSAKYHALIGYPKEKITIIHNGFNTSKYHPTKEFRSKLLNELDITNKDVFLIGHIGRFNPIKNHAGFINAASIINKSFPEVHFILAGDGVDSQNKSLNLIIDNLGVSKVVHMIGYRSDTLEIISSLDLLVSSSFGEAFPLVVGEAMSCEVPCVVTNVGDSAYLVNDTGEIVYNNSAYDIANGVKKILKMKEEDYRKMCICARYRIIDNFKIETIAKQYMEVYKGV